eukprot:GHVP01020927.1.p1 GENE.GHVP01020927.1~~GHVP01020927.1.p1  ORF type:complete len:123 (-),score=6.13 GHVP01020927.1:17-385(-)
MDLPDPTFFLLRNPNGHHSRINTHIHKGILKCIHPNTHFAPLFTIPNQMGPSESKQANAIDTHGPSRNKQKFCSSLNSAVHFSVKNWTITKGIFSKRLKTFLRRMPLKCNLQNFQKQKNEYS